MFESEIRIEVERRLQKACDDRATAGLPPPVSVEALRAVVRSDLMREIEAGRLAPKAAVPPKPKVLPTPVPKPAAPPAPKPTERQTATGRLMELAEKMDLRDPVFPSLREPARKPPVAREEDAASFILASAKRARG